MKVKDETVAVIAATVSDHIRFASRKPRSVRGGKHPPAATNAEVRHKSRDVLFYSLGLN